MGERGLLRSAVSGGGGGADGGIIITKIPFTKDSVSPLTLYSMQIGDTLYSVTVEITEAFDPGFSITIGFPSDPDEVVESDELDLEELDTSKFPTYKTHTVAEVLGLYITGTSTTGAGIVYVERSEV